MNYILHVIVIIGISLPAILGLNLVLGRGKILHFGSVGVGLFLSYVMFLTLHASGHYALAIALGIIATPLISLIFGSLAVRLDGDSFGILSIATHLAIIAIILNWNSLTRGALGIPQIPRMPGLSTLPAFALVMTLVTASWVFIMYRIDRGSLGRSLTALAENRFHAEALGISRVRTTLLAFIVSGFGSCISSIFYAQFIGILHPNDFQFHVLVFDIACVVAGGSGSVLGVTVATALLVALQESIRFLPLPFSVLGPLRLVIFGCVLLTAVYLRRDTVFPKSRTV